MSNFTQFFATCPKGVSSVLSEEIRGFGIEGVKELPSGVEFHGDLETAYRVILWSRTASRVLLPLATFNSADQDELYDGVRTVDWSAHMSHTGTLAVDFDSRSSQMTHTAYGARRVKDGIVDQFRDSVGERPSVDVEQPDIRINVHVFRDKATLSLDLSGDSLHRRGYRQEMVPAPLKENLAAALLLRTGWAGIAKDGGCLVDPMCGSGTFAIEAAMIAGDVAPALPREYFGFSGWLQHQPELWRSLIDEAEQRREVGNEAIPECRVSDVDPKACRATRINVAAAGLSDHIQVSCGEAKDLVRPEFCEKGLVIVNPPYGERLGELESLGPLYTSLGDVIKRNFVGWQAAIFTGNIDLAKQMGLRARRMHNFYNGALECTLLRFDVDPQWFSEPPSDLPRFLPESERGPGAQMLANRLRKKMKELGKWARKSGVSCYRLYDADMPEYAVAIDLYQGDKLWVHVQEYQAPKSIDARKARMRLREAISVIPEVLDVPKSQLYFKVRKRQKGSDQYEKLSEDKQFFEVEESGCRLLVNFADYLDTGLFLDHRITREMIGAMAKGKHFLNLFAYTGVATVHAAQGGAASTTTVDMSKTYMNWAQRNMALNGFKGYQYQFFQADCTQWLVQQRKAARTKYDLIFLDPPTFSSSKRMESNFDVQRDQIDLVRNTMALLDEEGTLIFSNNNTKFDLAEELRGEFLVENITEATIPRDFATNKKIHNCWEISWR